MRHLSLALAAVLAPSAPALAQEAARYVKNMTPGPHHAHLEVFVGSWEGTARHWMAPGAPPITGKTSSAAEAILDGRFVRFEGEMSAMGMKHQTMHVIGYDNAREKHVLWFVHSMSTGFQTAEGTCDAEGKAFTFDGVEEDPGIGWKRPFRTVIRVTGPDAFVVETTFPPRDGGDFVERAEVAFTRKKPGEEGG